MGLFTNKIKTENQGLTNMEIIYAIIALISALAAVLTWLAKLRWSKEFTAAKDEVIRSKDATIENLREQVRSHEKNNPKRLKENYEIVTSQLEEYNDSLQHELRAAKQEIELRNTEIKRLRSKGITTQDTVKNLESERSKFQEVKEQLEKELKQLLDKQDSKSDDMIPMPHLDQNLMQKSILILDNVDQMYTWRSSEDMLTSENIRHKLLLAQEFFQKFSSSSIVKLKDKPNTTDIRNKAEK